MESSVERNHNAISIVEGYRNVIVCKKGITMESTVESNHNGIFFRRDSQCNRFWKRITIEFCVEGTCNAIVCRKQSQ